MSDKKAYLVEKWSGNSCDDGITIGVYLDKQKCKDDVDKLNIPYKKEEKIHNECRKCRTDKEGEDINGFRFKNTCRRSCIKVDRNGKYCENDKSDYYQLKASQYLINEYDILG
jgi:hypothetical protein